ncbi:MAG: GumC family protein [Alphaproteobacteria bacterium]
MNATSDDHPAAGNTTGPQVEVGPYRVSDPAPWRATPARGDETELVFWLRTFWMRKWLVVGCVVLVTALALLIAGQLQPIYSATAHVMIESRQQNVVESEDVLSGISANQMTIESEAQIIGSRKLGGKVVDQLGLIDKPEFNETLEKESGLLASIGLDKELMQRIKVSLFGDDPLKDATTDELATLERDLVVETALGNLSVGPVGLSQVIEIRFESIDPRLAQKAANKFAELYIVDQLEAKFEATRTANAWLSERVDGLRREVERSEAAVVAYRERNKLVSTGSNSDLISQQVTEVSTQLVVARARRAEAEARHQQVQALLKSEGGLVSATEVLNSPLIQRLQEQESQVIRKRSELSSRYGARHPQMQNIDAELAELRRKIAIEVKKIGEATFNELEIAMARERSLKQSLGELTGTLGVQSRAEIRLNELEREAESNRLLYESFLSRFKETTEQEDLQRADSRIISEATVPREASFPDPRVFGALGAVIGGVIGVALAFLANLFSPGIRTTSEAQFLLGLPVLAATPRDRGVTTRRTLSYVIDNPRSVLTEAVRGLRTALLFSQGVQDHRVVVMTSSVPDEGKTTMSTLLARLSATSGMRVLLIDGDLRNPQLHKIFGVSSAKGLAQVLTGESTLQEMLHAQAADEGALDFLAAGVSRSTAIDNLLQPHRIGALFAELHDIYDLVIVDCPPMLAVSDPVIFGQHADDVLYLMRWNETPKETIAAGLDRFDADTRARKVKGVFSLVDAKASARYDYGMPNAYYGKLKSYYQDG